MQLRTYENVTKHTRNWSWAILKIIFCDYCLKVDLRLLYSLILSMIAEIGSFFKR